MKLQFRQKVTRKIRTEKTNKRLFARVTESSRISVNGPDELNQNQLNSEK